MWLWSLAHGYRIGLLLCDIAGAFDRVDSSILLRKCKEAGICDTLLNLLEDFFGPRHAEVVVNGARSGRQTIENQVYQGTVFGPPMWNTFFKNSSLPVMQSGAADAKFADDLTAYQLFPSAVTNDVVLEQLGRCQELVHQWGTEHRVEFDPAKEKLLVVHRSSPIGETQTHPRRTHRPKAYHGGRD